MECSIDNEGASPEEICRLEGSTGLQPTHRDSQVRAEYRNGACPTGSFPEYFHGVLSKVIPGRVPGCCNGTPELRPVLVLKRWIEDSI